MSSPQPTQIEGDAILYVDVLTDVTTLTEIINLNCIPSVQVHDTAVTRRILRRIASDSSNLFLLANLFPFMFLLRNLQSIRQSFACQRFSRASQMRSNFCTLATVRYSIRSYIT